jgi:hypothetical protein
LLAKATDDALPSRGARVTVKGHGPSALGARVAAVK